MAHTYDLPWRYDKVWKSSLVEILEVIQIGFQVVVDVILRTGIRNESTDLGHWTSGTWVSDGRTRVWSLTEINNSQRRVVASGDEGSEILSVSILEHFYVLFWEVLFIQYSSACRTAHKRNKSRTSKIVRCNVEKCLQDNVERQVISAQVQYTTIPTKGLKLNIYMLISLSAHMIHTIWSHFDIVKDKLDIMVMSIDGRISLLLKWLGRNPVNSLTTDFNLNLPLVTLLKPRWNIVPLNY